MRAIFGERYGRDLALSKNLFALAMPIPIKLRDAGGFVAGLGVERFDLVKIYTEGAEVSIIRSLGSVIRDTATVHVEFIAEMTGVPSTI